MKAHPTQQWRLLDLQALDTRLTQIAHRRTHLPENGLVERVGAHRGKLHTALVQAQTALGDIQREITKAEEDVTLVRDRAARNRKRLDEGTGSAKDLQALQHELASLDRRQAELEDVQLEVMERAEALEQQVDAQGAELVEVDRELATATAARDASLRVLDAEGEQVARDRAQLVPGIDAALVALYEKIRAQSGIGAAALHQQRCEGCRLQLTGADLARIAAADPQEVLRCEECRRILVRTDESGL